MGNIREYLATTKRVDFDYILKEWDIPADENITAYEANMWLHAQLFHNEEIRTTCVMEGMTNDEWDAAVDFVWTCLRSGVVPYEYVNLRIAYQQMYNELCGWT